MMKKGFEVRKMKRLLGLILSVALLVGSFSSNSKAADDSLKYGIQEHVDNEKRVIRTYSKEEETENLQNQRNVSSSGNGVEIKEVLSELGFDQTVIDNYSEERLRMFENAEEITSISVYTHNTSDGEIENLSEEEALCAVEILSEDDDELLDGEYQEIYEDSYMRIVLYIAYLGGGRYYYGVSARWLTTPLQRHTDSLGICTQVSTIVNNTRYGYLIYSWSQALANGQSISSGEKVEFGDSIMNSSNGSRDGSAGYFDLPDNDAFDYITYSNFFAYYEYEAYITDYSEPKMINVTATYSHLYTAIIGEPSVSIGLGLDSVSASIALRFGTFTDNRAVETQTPIHYIPD